MKLSHIVLASILILGSMSCGPDEVEGGGDLLVQFVAEFDGSPFFINKEYAFPDGRKVRFSQVDFYISDAVLKDVSSENNLTSDLEEVGFIDMSSSEINPLDPVEAQISALNVPAGDYSNLSFTLGLTDELNAKTPTDSDIGSTNPLSRSSHYWADWNSYIFMKIQGNADFNGNGEIEGEETFIYHTGKTGNEQRVSLNSPITIVKDELTQVSVAMDVSRIFYGADNNPRFDMSEDRSVHNENGLEIIEIIMEGSADAIKMN